MAITTQLVGKLGGGKLEKIEINFANPASNGTYDVVTVPIPQGVPHIMVLEIKTTASSSSTLPPEIHFDWINKGTYYGPFSAGGMYSSPVTIKAKKNNGSTSAAFTGTVYYAPTGT